MIEISFFGPFRDAAGTSECQIESRPGLTLQSVLLELCAVFGAAFEKLLRQERSFNILVNGQHYGVTGGLLMPLQDRDHVVLLSVLSGG